MIIDLKNVNKAFRNRQVLKNINFSVEEGQTVAIIGASGSGKSTLLKLLIGLEKPTSGEIWIDGEDIARLTEQELNVKRLHMGMVFQYSALFDFLNVKENVAFGLREHKHLSEKEIDAIVRDKLSIVGLADFANYMPQELSGGMQKRVSLARAIAFDPKIVFYDEPSSGLDPIMTGRIDELILQTQKVLGVTSIVVTHNMESAYYIADKIAMIHEGRIIIFGTAEDIKNSNDARVHEFITGGRKQEN